MTERRTQEARRSYVRQINYKRARDRALTRLANAYPDDYKKFLQEEKASDEITGKKWIDIDGNTGADMVSNTKPVRKATPTKDGDKGKNKGNNGGEA